MTHRDTALPEWIEEALQNWKETRPEEYAAMAKRIHDEKQAAEKETTMQTTSTAGTTPATVPAGTASARRSQEEGRTMSTPYNPNISHEDNQKLWAQEAIAKARKAHKESHEKYGTYCDICKRDLREYGAGPYRKINGQWHCYDCAASHDKHN